MLIITSDVCLIIPEKINPNSTFYRYFFFPVTFLISVGTEDLNNYKEVSVMERN